MTKRKIALFLFATVLACEAGAQIRVRPEWVNVNTMGGTTAFLTFAGTRNYVPVDAVWCGEVQSASPDIGFKPVAGTIFGELPARFDFSSSNGADIVTDIMSIPPSVARRAYQSAARGARSTFFYVRHFTSKSGGPDQYVSVTCELAGGGARTPFALTNIHLAFPEDRTLLSIKYRDPLPKFSAAISFTGTGELKGRWEIVRPGDDPPSEFDLLSEGTLPVEQRGKQRRYTEIERFSVFLPPVGQYTLEGPDPARLPSEVNGQYMILLRIEASEDNEAITQLGDLGEGDGYFYSGGAAGFSIPPLRYVVGAVHSTENRGGVRLMLPEDFAEVSKGQPLSFIWTDLPRASYHRLVVVDPRNTVVFSAIVRGGVSTYRIPPWLQSKVGATMCSWSVEALDEYGDVITKSDWRTLRFSP